MLDFSPATFCKQSYSKYTAMFGRIAQGLNPPAVNEYKPRVPLLKMLGVMQFIQSSFNPIVGSIKSISINGTRVDGIPMYTRERWTKDDAFTQYKAATSPDDAVGKPTFLEILDTMTKPGKSFSGLSTYLVDLEHHSVVFNEMIKSMEADNLINNAASILKDWADVKHFAMMNFSHCHLSSHDHVEDEAHCLKFAVGECSEPHVGTHCTQCAQLHHFFPNLRKSLPETLVSQITDAIKLMEYGFNKYLSHRARERWQKLAIDKIRLSMKPGDVYLVVDHKQKTLPMKHFESMSDYFGKTGMSVLGVWVTTCEIQDDGSHGYRH